jgi:hypothetical protein
MGYLLQKLQLVFHCCERLGESIANARVDLAVGCVI